MNVKQIRVSMGRTQNTGNYCSIRGDVEMVVEVEDGEASAPLFDKARKMLRAELNETIKEAKV